MCGPMSGATRPIAPMRPVCSKPIAVGRSMRCRSNRPSSKGVQALHRIREQLKAQRTATINLLRGVLREFGIVIALGAAQVRPAVLAALEDGSNESPMMLRHTLAEMLERLANLTHSRSAIDQRLKQTAQYDPVCQRS